MKAYINISYSYEPSAELFESDADNYRELIMDFLKTKGITEDNVRGLEIVGIRDNWYQGLNLVNTFVNLKSKNE